VIERRTAERTPIDVSLTCRIPARPLQATVRDVSHHGCRIEVPGAPIELGGTALIELPGVANVSGQIVWTQGKVAGVRFERALGNAAAIAIGLERPAPIETAPEIELAGGTSGGILRHWFRRLTACFG
jgi:hypothetical protein